MLGFQVMGYRCETDDQKLGRILSFPILLQIKEFLCISLFFKGLYLIFTNKNTNFG